MPNLGQTKTRLLTMGALITAGTLVSGAVGGLVAGLAGNILANDLGDLAKRLGENEDILSDRELSQAVWQAIALVIESVAEQNDYPLHKDILKRLAKSTLAEPPIDVQLDTTVEIAETQLPELFSTKAEEFQAVRVLDLETWKDIVDWLCNLHNISIPELRNHLAERLYVMFPSALREVLKEDAAKGGQAFAAMQLLLLGNITAALKQSNSQNTEIVKKLEDVATAQQLCEIVARVESGIGEDLAEIKRALSAIAAMQIRRLSVPLNFQLIIEEKTEEFVGREFVFTEIEKFFQEKSKGYFIIEADPGMGKSSILAEFVRRNDCIVYFNNRSAGITSTEEFIRSVCTQLIEGYKLSYSTEIQLENTRNNNFLLQLLHEASQTLQSNERLIIAVDALDEVDLNSQSDGGNVLYLPDNLPNDVYFIVTKRPQRLPLRINDERFFNLMQYKSQNEEDVQNHIRKRIGKSQQLKVWIHNQRLEHEEFVTTLATKSESNFEYLRHVLPAIEHGEYQDLNIENLPKGLNSYYENHWQRMVKKDDSLLELKIKIMYLLGVVREPVSRSWIAKRLATQNTITVQQILDYWEQFLSKQHLESETRYSLYHTSFRDFLYRLDIVQAAGETIESMNDRVVDSFTKGFFWQ